MASSKKKASSKAKTGARKSNATKTATRSQPRAGSKNAVSKKAAIKKAASQAPPPVSFAKQIAPLFRTMDVQCMRARGVFLKNYDYMKDPDNANLVLDMLKPDADPRMPYGGPYWTDANIQLLQDWINDGLQP
jgi:hypothetical protein